MESGSSTPEVTVDPDRKYSVQDPNNKNNFKCNFCGKIFTGGVYRLKQHLAGGWKNAVDCNLCPKAVREEIRSYMSRKEAAREEQTRSRMLSSDFGFNDDDDEDCVEIEGNGKRPQKKKPRQKSPMDRWCTPNPEEVVKSRKDGRQQTINQVVHKELRDKACKEIARWFYDAGIPFHAATYDSFKIMIEAIGQFGPGMKAPSMYELRVPLLNNEVNTIQKQVSEQKKEWEEKGCSDSIGRMA